jgi:hypothetical protein
MREPALPAPLPSTMKFYPLILGVLAVWRITHLLQAEDGPWDLIVRLRRWAGNGFRGNLLDCFYCLSLWIAAPFAVWLGTGTAEKFLLWTALSGAAILLERITAATPQSTEPYWKEEDRDVLLRKEEK